VTDAATGRPLRGALVQVADATGAVVTSIYSNDAGAYTTAIALPAGTYYACADFGRFGFEDDVAFCRHLIEEVGVAAIPPSAFYDRPEKGRGYVRFAFCKKMATLKAAVERLEKLCA